MTSSTFFKIVSVLFQANDIKYSFIINGNIFHVYFYFLFKSVLNNFDNYQELFIYYKTIIKLIIQILMSQHSFRLIADNNLRGQQAIIHSIKGVQQGSCIEVNQNQHQIFIIYRPNLDAPQGTIKIGKALMQSNGLQQGVCLIRPMNQPIKSCKTAKMIVNQLDWKIVNSRMGLLQQQFLNQNQTIWPQGKIPLYYTKNDYVVLISKSENIERLEQNTQIVIQTQQQQKNPTEINQTNKISNLIYFPLNKIEKTDEIDQRSYILTLQCKTNINGYHHNIQISQITFQKLKLKKQCFYFVDNCLSLPQSQLIDIQLYLNYIKVQQGNQNQSNPQKQHGLKKRTNNIRLITINTNSNIPQGHFSCSELTKKILNLEDIIQFNNVVYDDWKSITLQMFLKQQGQNLEIKIISDQPQTNQPQFIRNFCEQLIIQHLDPDNSMQKRQIIIFPERPYVLGNNIIYIKIVSQGKNKNSEFANKPIKLVNNFKKDILRKAIQNRQESQQIKQFVSKIKIMKPPIQGYDTQFIQLFNLVNQNQQNELQVWNRFAIQSFCQIYKSQLETIVKHLSTYADSKIIQSSKQFNTKMLIITSHMNNGKSFLRQVLKQIYQISCWSINFADLALKALTLSIVDLTSYLTTIFLQCPFKIIYLDNFDSLCYQIDNGDVHRQNQKILSKLIIRLLKKLSRETKKVIIITSNSLQGIDEEIFYGLGGFQHIVLNNPSRQLRRSLLSQAKAIREHSQERFQNKFKRVQKKPTAQSNQQSISFGSLLQTAKGYPPLASRKAQQKKTKFDFSCLAGLNDAKKLIRRTIQKPIKYSQLYKKLPIKMPRGVLLYGGTGTGKSALGSALQDEFHMKFFTVKGSDILSKYIGGSEAAVRDIFQKAMSVAPSIIFFDEFETIVPRRNSSNTGVTDRVVNQFLCYLDGVASINGVFIVASSSRPDLIDPALLRPGRLDIHIYLDYPNSSQRLQLLKTVYKDSITLELTDEQYIEYTQGYNYSDLVGLYKQLRIKKSADVFKNMQNPKKQDFKTIQTDFFKQTYKNFKPSTTKQQQQKQKQLYQNFRTGKKLDMKNQKTALY